MHDGSESRSGPGIRQFLVIAGIALAALIAWQLVGVILLFFGAVVVATILRSVSDLIERGAPIPSPWPLVLAGLAILLLIAAFLVLMGAQLSGQLSTLIERLPGQLAAVGERFGMSGLDMIVSRELQRFFTQGGIIQYIADYTSGLVGAIAGILLVVIGGFYLAVRPEVYLEGCLLVFPPAVRSNVAAAAVNAGRALKLWLLGQFISMALVGVLIAVGLRLLGVPSALALGLLSGLAEFVPVVGPIVGAVPALVVALSEGGATVLWVIALYLAVQQLESNLITPLVQRRVADLPPALTLFALVALGVLFGPLGVLLAGPLTVVFYVGIKQLYLRDVLHEHTEVPGERKRGKKR